MQSTLNLLSCILVIFCTVGLFTICLPKLVKGRNFPDLDLVTKLLAPTGKSSTLSPGIEVIRGETESDCSDEEDWEWEWKQELPDEKVCFMK